MNTKTRSFRPSPAMFVACIALFIALAGSAVAAGVVGKNSVGSPQIIDAGVRNADLHNGAVGATKISPAAVTTGAIAEGAVGSTEVAPDSLTAADIANGAVGAAELGTVGVRTNTATVEAGKVVGVASLCNSGEKVIGGGGAPSDLGVAMISSRPQSNGWAYQAKNNSGATATVTVYAMCLAG